MHNQSRNTKQTRERELKEIDTVETTKPSIFLQNRDEVGQVMDDAGGNLGSLLHELSSQQEYLKLKARYEALQRTQRNLLGEDLGPLNSKELESLERQLDMSLKQIRSIRTQHMLDQFTDLQHKEHLLGEANKNLKQRLVEGYHVHSLQLNPSAEDVAYGRQQAQPQGDGFFHPLDCEPTLQIGYPTDPITTAGPSVNNYICWFLTNFPLSTFCVLMETVVKWWFRVLEYVLEE
ncbi:agamous-like MADS-box protein MADS4 [Tripterygium wilfordii]|uniref:agamous-like MADS-box protein MADS4 n=1 Tax=Tripterygium wilfordii TaxID=458696 RepID=UPI0018F82914|nr:agamous-like MADS-box protein MADS4 [Tripterygium wilfordii]